MNKLVEVFALLALIALLLAVWAAPADAQTPPDAEVRFLWRDMPAPQPGRLYFGYRDPESLMTYTWFIDTEDWQEAQIRALGSMMMRKTTWPRPRGTTTGIWWPAVTACDRWYLWADDEGARAPAMTRRQKLAQVCGS